MVEVATGAVNKFVGGHTDKSYSLRHFLYLLAPTIGGVYHAVWLKADSLSARNGAQG